MKKSVVFLVNGLGIERPGSYSISIEECMPNLCKVRDVSYFTTAITDSIEPVDAYQRFFLGDTYKSEVNYIKNILLDSSFTKKPTFTYLKNTNSKKYHIFVEPTNDKVVELINQMIQMLELSSSTQIYLHLILPQQSTKEFEKINNVVNYIRYHIDSRIQVGFVFGKEFFQEPLSKNKLDFAKNMFFSCTCERWREIDKKFSIYQEKNIRPCDIDGFCAVNTCFIENFDTILFFNTRRENYDPIITAIYDNARSIFTDKLNLPSFSLISLNSKYAIPYFIDNVSYENSLSNMLKRNHKKMLILTDVDNINLVNFYANGFNSINNPDIAFMGKSDDLYKKEAIERLIQETPYDLILFDYHMDTSSTINHLKEELSKIDVIIGLVANQCENRHSLFITSLYGLNKKMPIAEYNKELVTINYERQIPIFFFDYFYPKSKYDLFPGETYDILCSALNCITNDSKIDSLIREKTFLGNILKAIVK